MVVHSKKMTDGIAAPSVSFIAKIKMPEGRNSWKGKYNGPNDIISASCEGANDIKDCIESKTFRRREFLMDALLGWTRKESLMDDNLWSSDFTNPRAGMVHTLKVGTKQKEMKPFTCSSGPSKAGSPVQPRLCDVLFEPELPVRHHRP